MPTISRNKFGASRVVLLVEAERYCQQTNCLHLNRIGLTKAEARAYNGFKCERCECWNEDVLTERDVPEWWEEISVNSQQSAVNNK